MERLSKLIRKRWRYILLRTHGNGTLVVSKKLPVECYYLTMIVFPAATFLLYIVNVAFKMYCSILTNRVSGLLSSNNSNGVKSVILDIFSTLGSGAPLQHSPGGHRRSKIAFLSPLVFEIITFKE